jgi:hypothetical protein
MVFTQVPTRNTTLMLMAVLPRTHIASSRAVVLSRNYGVVVVRGVEIDVDAAAASQRQREIETDAFGDG